MSVFMIYCPQFWGSKSICMARKTRYMFESYDQKLIVFAFYGHFHELLPMIYNDLKTRYMFESYDQKLVVFVFFAIFMSYFPQFLGCKQIRKAFKTRYMFERYNPRLVVFAFYDRFHELLPLVLWF